MVVDARKIFKPIKPDYRKTTLACKRRSEQIARMWLSAKTSDERLAGVKYLFDIRDYEKLAYVVGLAVLQVARTDIEMAEWLAETLNPQK